MGCRGCQQKSAYRQFFVIAIIDANLVIAETDSSGSLKKSYVYGAPGLLAMTVYGSSTNTYFMLTDHLGTVHAIANESGSIVESYKYDAWGRILGVYNGSGQPISESAIGNRFLFHGKEYSWKTGLYYNRARWYDPITGRFISKDPSGISGGLNEYEFCNNNPVNFIDPDGEVAIEAGDWWAASAVNGVEKGGVAGYAQAVGCSIATSFLDFFGARSIERNAGLSGMYSATDGCKGNAWKYGAYAVGEIGLNAFTHGSSMAAARASRSATLFSKALGQEGERASKELLDAVAGKGRTITIAKEGSDELRFLNAMKAEASVGGPGHTSIILRESPSKAAVLEEFLHGTQDKLGIVERLGAAGAEAHVSSFMSRHAGMLGL